ncbi:MAG: SdrD B-like domain-containing protein, partial [Saprospiraceae bacterium]
RVIVTQGIGCQTVSDPLTITVVEDPTVSITPSATTVCAGGVVTITSSVTGGAGSINYQWQQFVSGAWTNVGTNNATFVTPSLAAGSYNYRVVISMNSGCSNESNTVSITAINDPVVTITGDNSICEGEFVVISSNITGGVSTYNFHWQQLQAGNWVEVGTTQPTFNTGDLAEGTYSYRLVIDNALGCDAVSNTFITTAYDRPVVTLNVAANPICVGGVAALTYVLTGGSGTSTYSWQYNNPTNGWTQVSTSSTNYSTSLGIAGSYEYRLIVTQSTGCIAISYSLIVVVNPDPTVTAAINNPNICVGGSALITSTIVGGSGSPTYQWYSGPATNGPWTLISGATTSTYAPPTNSIGSTWYRVNVTDPVSGCFDPFSNSVQLVLVADPTITTGTMDDIYCLGESVTMNVVVTGGTGTTTYQWQSFDGTSWSNVGGNSSSYDPGSLAEGNYLYRAVVVQNSGCEGMSSNITLTVLSYPEASVSSTPASCGDNAGTITVTFSDNPYATELVISIDGGLTYTAPIPDNQGSYTFNSLAPGMYPVWVKWAANECSIFVSNADVGNLACGTICGNVRDDVGQIIGNVIIRLYKDLNNNNVYDTGETLVNSTTTDADSGNYCFEDIPAGEYVVLEVQPANYYSLFDHDFSTSTSDDDGYAGPNDPNDMVDVTLAVGEADMNNDFVEDPYLGSISGYVLNDVLAPLANVVVKLYADPDQDGVQNGTAISTTTTNTSGFYQFTGLEPAFYVVVETNPISYSNVSDYDYTVSSTDLDGDDSAQGPDNNIPVRVAPGEADNENNFIDGRPGSICGTVHDLAGQPLSNVQIKLYLDVNNNDSLDAADVLVATTFTDGDSGNYCFEDITPAEYV